MTLPAGLWEQVRQRANASCEYCGVAEIDAGGLLTVDHYQPRSAGGTDDFHNLVYACFRCNGYKADYWPAEPAEPPLWNPRIELSENHRPLLADGTLYPITPIGKATITVLHLNRPTLVAYRLLKTERTEDSRRLARLEERLTTLESLQRQHAVLMNEIVTANQRVLALIMRGDVN